MESFLSAETSIRPCQFPSSHRLPSSKIPTTLFFLIPTSRSPSLTPQFPAALSALKSPKGFGPPSPRNTRKKQKKREDEEESDDEEGESEAIPEVVTNRMIKRMGLSVGIPLGIGLLFFPFFYYLKIGLKADVPSWLPVMVSFFFFGSALLGVSYGIVSSSWDPLREGSLLGWKEAQKNWPVFWESIWGRNQK